MNKEISNKLTDYARENDAIDTIFYVLNDNYESIIHVYTLVNDVIIGKLEEELVGLFDNLIMVNRSKGEFSINKTYINYTNLNIYTDDNLKLTESIISSEYADDFIKTIDGDIKILYSKPGFNSFDIESKFVFDKPKEYEVVSTIKNFFASAYEVSLYIDQKDQLATCMKMDSLRNYLIAMINFYIKDKYSYKLDMGDDGQRLHNTLEVDIKESLLLTYHHDDLMDIYYSLFKATVLFRKLAMDICKKFNFVYPKEIDVETHKVLRKNYKKLESFLN